MNLRDFIASTSERDYPEPIFYEPEPLVDLDRGAIGKTPVWVGQEVLVYPLRPGPGEKPTHWLVYPMPRLWEGDQA